MKKDFPIWIFLTAWIMGVVFVLFAIETSAQTTGSLQLQGTSFVEITPNGNNTFTPGASFSMSATLGAINQNMTNAYATLSSTDPCVSIQQGMEAFGSITSGSTANNAATPFAFSISSSCAAGHNINFTLTMAATDYSQTTTITIVVSSSLYALGWTDLGSNTVLSTAAAAPGLSPLVNCIGSTPPAYCTGVAANFSFLGLVQYVEAAQSGAAIDTIHNHMYITGGGHGDYLGNQFYDYDVSANTLTRLTDPSPMSGITYAQYNLDGTGVSSHTEQGLVYLPNEDAVFKLGIGAGPAPADQQFIWWITNPRTHPTWVPKAENPILNPYLVVSGGTSCTNGLQTGSFTNGGGTGGTFSVWVSGGVPTGYASIIAGGSGYTSVPTQGTVSGCTGTTTFTGGAIASGQAWNGMGDAGTNCLLDTTSATESVLCVSLTNYQLFRYTPSLDSGPGSSPWTALSSVNSTEIVAGATCRIDPVHKVLVCAGATFNSAYGFPSGIYSISLAPGSNYAATNITNSTTGCSALYSVTNPGFAYDSSTGLFVGYVGTGNSLTLYNYATQTCTTTTINSGPTSAAYPSPSGIYDRFAYYPSLNKYLVANNAQADIFSLQLNSTSGTTAPSTPTNLTASAISSTQINLSWGTSTESGGTVVGYNIYRGGVQVGTSSTTTYADTGLNASTTYNYTVSAYDASGNTSAQSSTANATTQASGSGGGSSTLTQGLVGYWNFDEGTGTVLHDTSGNGNNGTINGATWVPGIVGTGALSFNGNASVTIPYSPVFNLSVFSVSVWVNTNSATQYQQILGSNEYDHRMLIESPYGGFIETDFGTGIDSAVNAISLNTWHLITYVEDGAGQKVYVDGVLSASDTNINASFTNNSNSIMLGINVSGGFGFSGLMDDLRVYNRALSAQEVSSLYTGAGSITTTPPTGPSVPTGLTAIVASATQVNLTWTASTESGGTVTGYNIYRNGTQVGTSTAASYSDTGLIASTTYNYTVSAYDASGNVSAQSSAVSATTFASGTSGSTGPVLTFTSTPAGAILSPNALTDDLTVSASSANNPNLASIQLLLDGNNWTSIGLDSSGSIYWDTTTVSNGNHTITAIGTDNSGNTITAPPLTVTVSNAFTTAQAAPLGPANPNGLGASTYTCIDPLGKGYGVGPGCLGPDADETDPVNHTGAQVIAKWGSLQVFLNHLGYNPTRIWYMAPAVASPNCNASLGACVGNDTTGAINDVNHPFQTYAAINGQVVPGDMIMMRDQWSDRMNLPSGTAGNPVIVMSFPGEQANLVGNADLLDTSDRSYMIIDGLKLSQGAYIGVGTVAGGVTETEGITFHDNIFRHIDAVGPFGGLGGMYGFSMYNVTVEDSAFHDNDAQESQHGIYMGSRTPPGAPESSNVIFQRLLLYHNAWNGIHWNGQCTGCSVNNVIAYSNGISGLDFEMGWNHSVIENNLSFNNPKALTLYDYPGQCPAQNNYTAGTVYICPFDENYNVIENNVFYNTGNDAGFSVSSGCPAGVADCENAAITIRNVTEPLMGNFDHNIFRNNMIMDYGYADWSPPVSYSENNGAGEVCDATCMNWLSTSAYQNNIFHQEDGNNGINIISASSTGSYTCATAASVTTMSSCANTSPGFVNANIGLWTTPTAFDFHLQSTSPALGAGTATGTPTYDIVGNTFNNPPSIGAYEFTSGGLVLGNPSGTGTVTIYDAELVAQYAVGLTTFTPAQQRAAEVSSSTEASPTIYDAYLIAEYAVGLITKFPAQT